MLKTLTDLPEGVIGFEGEGKIVASDYTDVLMPAVEAAAKAGGVRVVLVFAEWDGFSAGGMWEDLKLGVEHLTTWKRIALVADLEWMHHLTALFGWMTPGALKVFPLAERDEAIAWAGADLDG